MRVPPTSYRGNPLVLEVNTRTESRQLQKLRLQPRRGQNTTHRLDLVHQAFYPGRGGSLRPIWLRCRWQPRLWCVWMVPSSPGTQWGWGSVAARLFPGILVGGCSFWLLLPMLPLPLDPALLPGHPGPSTPHLSFGGAGAGGVSIDTGLGPPWTGHTRLGGWNGAVGVQEAVSKARMGGWGQDCRAVTAQG